MKNLVTLFVIFLLAAHSFPAFSQNTFPSSGFVGIGTLAPATNLQVIGKSRFGSAINYLQLDTGGSLSFVGSGAFKIGANKYAFQYGTTTYGLMFNQTNSRYEFRDGSGLSVLHVNYGTGNGYVKGGWQIGNNGFPIA